MSINSSEATMMDPGTVEYREDMLTVLKALTAQAVRRNWTEYLADAFDAFRSAGFDVPETPEVRTYRVPVRGYVTVTREGDSGASYDDDTLAAVGEHYDRAGRYADGQTFYGSPYRVTDDAIAVVNVERKVPTREQWDAWSDARDWTLDSQWDVRHLIDATMREAQEAHDWCTEYDDAVEVLNSRLHVGFLTMPEREREFTVHLTVTRTYSTSVSVTASSDDDASEIVENDADSYVDLSYLSPDEEDITVTEVYEG